MEKTIKFNIKINFTPKKIIYIAYFLIIIIVLINLSGLSLFLYNNLYQTITQSKEIIILRELVAIDVVDIDKFNKIIGKINQKTAPAEPVAINNLFN